MPDLGFFYGKFVVFSLSLSLLFDLVFTAFIDLEKEIMRNL